MGAHHEPEYAIIARQPVENDEPALLVPDGWERLQKARQQWAYIVRQRECTRKREQKQREARERLKEQGRKAAAAKKKAS